MVKLKFKFSLMVPKIQTKQNKTKQKTLEQQQNLSNKH